MIKGEGNGVGGLPSAGHGGCSWHCSTALRRPPRPHILIKLIDIIFFQVRSIFELTSLTASFFARDEASRLFTYRLSLRGRIEFFYWESKVFLWFDYIYLPLSSYSLKNAITGATLPIIHHDGRLLLFKIPNHQCPKECFWTYFSLNRVHQVSWKGWTIP